MNTTKLPTVLAYHATNEYGTQEGLTASELSVDAQRTEDRDELLRVAVRAYLYLTDGGHKNHALHRDLNDVMRDLLSTGPEEEDEPEEDPIRNRGLLLRVIATIGQTLTWHKLPGGFTRWCAVYDNLRAIADVDDDAMYSPYSDRVVPLDLDAGTPVADALDNSFWFSKTPQGSEYWEAVYRELRKVDAEWGKPVEKAKPDLDASTKTRIANAAWAVANHFTWSDTDQGYPYWSTVFKDLRDLADGARPTVKDEEHASYLLSHAMVWANTPQGQDYWQQVHENLQAVEETAGYDKNAERYGEWDDE